MALEIGTIAPNFTADTDGNGKLSLNDFKGKWVVLYFYPKDNTPGCTKEACSFRDNLESIKANNTEIIGVSPDTVKSHDKFKEKYNLNFHLAADPEKKICELYDVIGNKSMFGKIVKGVKRTTYIIDPNGKIAYVYPKVKVDGHSEEVLSKLKELQNNL